jgi:hypothetical protein
MKKITNFGEKGDWNGILILESFVQTLVLAAIILGWIGRTYLTVFTVNVNPRWILEVQNLLLV